MKNVCFIVILFLLSMAVFCEVRVYAVIEKEKAYLDVPLKITVRIHDCEEPIISRLPESESFTLEFQSNDKSDNQYVTIINGKKEINIVKTHHFTYQLIPHKAGDLIVPAIEILVDGKNYYTNELKIHVNSISELADFKLEMFSSLDNFFQGELIHLHYKFSFRKNLKNLHFDIPFLEDSRFYIQPVPLLDDSDKMKYELKIGQMVIHAIQDEEKMDDGTSISVLEFFLTIRVLESGVFVLDKTMLSFEGEIANKKETDLFGRNVNQPVYEKLIILSNPLELKVKPLPEQGKPAHFSGLTGIEKISADIVSVPGNWNSTFILKLKFTDTVLPAKSDILPPPQSLSGLEKDFITASFWVPGRGVDKTSEYFTLISPKSDSKKVVPPLVFPVFDPEEKKYSTLKTSALDLPLLLQNGGAPGISEASKESSIACQFVIDCSSSMQVQKIMENSSQSRLEMIVKTCREYIAGKNNVFPGLKENLLGLTTFARNPQLLTSMSLEHGNILQQLAMTSIVSNKNEDGSNIADALQTAVLDFSLLKARESAASINQPSQKIIILITDGVNNRAGYISLDTTLNTLIKNEINLFVISIGPEGWFYVVDQLGGKVKKPVSLPEKNNDDLQSLCLAKNIPFWSVGDEESLRLAFQNIQTLLEKGPGK